MILVVLLVPVILLKFKVSGHSMEPLIKNGQEVLVSKLPFLFKNPKIGDVVAFKNNNKIILKRIEAIKDGKYLMKGDNKKDSKGFGLIDKKDVIGKMIYIIG